MENDILYVFENYIMSMTNQGDIATAVFEILRLWQKKAFATLTFELMFSKYVKFLAMHTANIFLYDDETNTPVYFSNSADVHRDVKGLVTSFQFSKLFCFKIVKSAVSQSKVSIWMW